MIPGTSKILSKSGPVDLLTITKMLQTIQENYGIILGTSYFVNFGTQKTKTFEELYVLGTIGFSIVFIFNLCRVCFRFVLWKFEYICLK